MYDGDVVQQTPMTLLRYIVGENIKLFVFNLQLMDRNCFVLAKVIICSLTGCRGVLQNWTLMHIVNAQSYGKEFYTCHSHLR